MWLADLGPLGPLSLLCLLPLLPGCWALSITEFQVPEFVEYGHVAQLKCKYDLSGNESDRSLFVKWWWSPLNSSNEDRSQLYQRIAGYEAEAIPDNVEIDVDDGIKLLNVTAKDSGIYECEVSNIDEVRRRQKLIVYSQGSGPLLNVSLSEDETEVEVTCEALDVAPYPDISISLNGVTVESTGNVSDPVDGLYDIVENATVTLMEADGKTFSCEILFKEGNFTPPAFVASQIFYAPTVSTTEAAEDAATAIEDSSETSQPDVSESIMFGGSWAMMATAALWLCCAAHHQFFNLPIF